jgi:hypothetical protein
MEVRDTRSFQEVVMPGLVGRILLDSTGTYYTDLSLLTPDDWVIRAICTTPTAGAVEVGFTVLQSAVV